MAKPFIRFRLSGGDDPAPRKVEGRQAWALGELLVRRDRGVSSLEHVGPRLAHYVMKLRSAGLAIEIVHEDHGGTFKGWHARYVLRSPVEVVERAGV